MICAIELDALEPDLSERCEQEFQRQADLYDGELFWYFDSAFEKVGLIRPSLSAQVVLGYFANCGCPVCCLRFGASLHPYIDARWPVRSCQAAVFYMLGGLEILLNLQYEARIKSAIQEFESTKECKILLHVADHIITTNSLTSSICPEILSYINKLLYQTRDNGIEIQ
ncbi:hypothetical protein GCM10011357_16220 [Lacimicrobium alkaliphilum]|uniref:Uncharacterized protein n=1 Tax=Lacimicrobium alkaliphilum TaxID=1526571 RepID=A0ABQ1RAM7_9ALTE|nr:hypothetical protein GCM10011357_16220 [Lacimicrobium alkaliphilum]